MATEVQKLVEINLDKAFSESHRLSLATWMDNCKKWFPPKELTSFSIKGVQWYEFRVGVRYDLETGLVTDFLKESKGPPFLVVNAIDSKVSKESHKKVMGELRDRDSFWNVFDPRNWFGGFEKRLFVARGKVVLLVLKKGTSPRAKEVLKESVRLFNAMMGGKDCPMPATLLDGDGKKEDIY